MANERKSGVPAILDGISRTLDETFPGVSIYGDTDVAQGLEPPAFFIAVLTPSRSPGLGPRYRAVNPFDVHYFPAEEGNNAELLDVAEQLMDALETITVQGNLVRGTKRSYELADGVLHFFVNYDLTGRRAVPDDPGMEDADVKTGIKE